MKTFTDAQFAFKAAVRRAVKSAGGPNAASDFVRVDAPRLSRYGNIDSPEFAPVDVCFELDKAAGDAIILRAWANELGFALLPRETVQASVDLVHAVGVLAKETGEMVSAAIEAGPNPTPAVARRLDDEAADVEQAASNVRKINRPAMG